MLKLIILRHGQTEGNKSGIHQGRNDTPLTEEGINQVEKARDYLKNTKIDAVFSSPLGRAKSSADIISKANNLPTIVDNNLAELHWGGDFGKARNSELIGKWEKFYNEQLSKGIKREEIRLPDGENVFDHMKRINKFINMLKSKYKDKTVLIVGHGGTNRVLIGILQNKDPDDFYLLPQHNACINIIEIDKDGKILKEELNITEHLK